MFNKESSRFLDIYNKAAKKYSGLEDRAVSLAHSSFTGGFFRRSSWYISVGFSGCFVAKAAGEDGDLVFAAGSILIKNFRDMIYYLERSLLSNYAFSFTRSFFSAVAGSSCEVDWESVKKDSWFFGKIYHA